MLDTDVLVDLKRKHPPALVWFDALDGMPSISPFSVVKLLCGCRDNADRQAALLWLAAFPIIYPSAWGMEKAGELTRFRLSHGLDALDAFIAATALEYEEPLLTFNRKHFGAVPGLTIAAPSVK